VSETFNEELSGYSVGGHSKGVTGQSVIVSGIAMPTTDTTAPGEPSVAFDGTNYLVVYRKTLNTSNTAFGNLYGTLYSASGTVISTFPISNLGATAEHSVAFDGTNYLVVFIPNTGSGQGIVYGQRISKQGALLDGSMGFAISTPGAASDNLPAVAFDGTNYTVVWSRYPYSGTGLTPDLVYAQVTPSGSVGALTHFGLSAIPGPPSIDFDGTNYLVVWKNAQLAPMTISGARISTTGTLIETGGFPICSTGATYSDPRVAFDGTNHLVVWEKVYSSNVESPTTGDIFGKRVTTSGIVLDGGAAGDGIVVNNSSAKKGAPVVGFDGTNYVVAWPVGVYSTQPPVGIYGTILSTSGVSLSGSTTDAGMCIGGLPPVNSTFLQPVVVPGGGNTLVFWVNSSENKDIRAVRLFPLNPW
jgi:hypothetical protein